MQPENGHISSTLVEHGFFLVAHLDTLTDFMDAQALKPSHAHKPVYMFHQNVTIAGFIPASAVKLRRD